MSERSKHPKYVWWKGGLVAWDDATVHVTELGWSTVPGVFEGIRGYWNPEQNELYVFRLKEHLERLYKSCKLVRLSTPYPYDEVWNAIIALLKVNDTREDTYIRPMAYVSNTSGKRFSQLESNAEMLINTSSDPSHLGTGYTQAAKVSSWRRISDTVMPPRAKGFSNYRNGQLATLEAKADGYDVAFMLNDRGQVSEAPGACLMFVANGKLITPDTRQSILESVTRDALITLARDELQLEVIERDVDRTELYLADEVFTCGTAAEITPVTSVDKYQIGNGEIGPITTQLEKLFHDVLRGREQKYASWRTPVGIAELTAV